MRSDPAEIISPAFPLVLNYLWAEELLICAMVNRLWRSKVDTPQQWEKIFFLYFPNEFRFLKLSRAPIISWMRQFRRENKLLSRNLAPLKSRFPYSEQSNYREITAFAPIQERLHAYCKEGNTSAIEKLCESLALSDLTLTDYYGFDALYYLTFHRRSDIAQILYEKVIFKKYSSSSPANFSLLCFAVATQQFQEISRLIESGEDLNETDSNGRSPLFIASQNGDEDTVSKLLNAGATIMRGDAIFNMPVHVASQNGHLNIVRKLLELVLKLDPDFVSLENASSNTPLYLACRNGHDEVVEVLLEAGAELDIKSQNGFTPLAIACQNGHGGIVRKLLQKRADPKYLDDTCVKVVSAFSYGSTPAMIPKYLDGISYIDAKNSRDETAFNAAISNGHGALLVPILLENYMTRLLHPELSPEDKAHFQAASILRLLPTLLENYISRLLHAKLSSENKACFQAASTLLLFALGKAKAQELEAHRTTYRKDSLLKKYSTVLFKQIEDPQEKKDIDLSELLKQYFAAKNTCESIKAEAIEKQVRDQCGNKKYFLEPYLALALIHLHKSEEFSVSQFQAAQLWASELDPDWSQSKIILEKWISQAIISHEMMDSFFEGFSPLKHQPN